MWQGGPDDINFNRVEADAFIGKYLLVGITYLDSSENIIERKQFHGIIESISPKDGIKICLKGKSEGEFFILPPDLSTLTPAAPGVYSLKATKEDVLNPDFTTQWTLKKPEKKV